MAGTVTGGRLRVNMGFSPLEITGLVAWYDASNAASITSSGGLVSQWNDLSGNGNHLTQNSDANKPTTGTRTQKSNNVIDFNGLNNYIDKLSVNLTQPFTCMGIYKQDDTAKGRVWDWAAGGARSLYNANGGFYGIYSGNVVNVAASGTNIICHLALFNGSASKVQLDGSLTTGLNPGAAGHDHLRLGADGDPGAFLDGFICELAFWTGDGSSYFTNMRSYAQTKWATP